MGFRNALKPATPSRTEAISPSAALRSHFRHFFLSMPVLLPVEWHTLAPKFGLLHEHRFGGQAEWASHSSTAAAGRFPVEAPVQDPIQASVGVEAAFTENVSLTVRANASRDLDGDYRSVGGGVDLRYMF